jgi:hypothetical protein
MTPLYSDVFEMPSEISDHDAAVAFLKCPKSTSCSFTREIWQYENIDLELFNNKMKEINWNEMILFNIMLCFKVYHLHLALTLLSL